MTENEAGDNRDWVPVLRGFSRASGHELRNALNALVVNLEVVRARTASLDESVRRFVDEAVAQSEESVRLAEGSIALLNMVVGAIGEEGVLEIEQTAPRSASIPVGQSDAERTSRSLLPLAQRAGYTVNASGTAVILSIPEKAPDIKESE